MLRFDHPSLHGRLTGVSWGCDLLAALGFQVRLENTEGTQFSSSAAAAMTASKRSLPIPPPPHVKAESDSDSVTASGLSSANGGSAVGISSTSLSQSQDHVDLTALAATDGNEAHSAPRLATVSPTEPVDSAVILELAAVTRKKVVFCMEEPGLDDTKLWIEWFDLLSAIQSEIANIITKIAD